MPYELKKVKGGWKVQIKGGRISSTGRRYFSDSPLPRERAVAQMRALYASEGRKSPTGRKPASSRRSTKSPTRKRKPSSPKRTTKSPTRKRKPSSPKRKHKRPVSPKYKRK